MLMGGIKADGFHLFQTGLKCNWFVFYRTRYKMMNVQATPSFCPHYQTSHPLTSIDTLNLLMLLVQKVSYFQGRWMQQGGVRPDASLIGEALLR